MKRAVRMALLVSAAIVLASGVVLHAGAGQPSHANRLEASFSESPASITNRIADLIVAVFLLAPPGGLTTFRPVLSSS